MLPFPWLETQAVLHAACSLLSLVEAVILIVVGLVFCLTAVVPQDCSALRKEDRVGIARIGLLMVFLLSPVVYALGLYLNLVLLAVAAVGALLLTGRSVLLALGK